MAKSEKIFELSSLCRSYKVGDELVNALGGVDLTISDREFIAVVGSSGSGKSTLMHMLGFMDSPTSGKMLFEGRDVSAIDREERSRLRAMSIGFVFQAFNLLPKLTVLDNVILPLIYSRKPVKNKAVLARKALERVGMEHRSTHTPGQLSGGERQRVAIARSLINEPRLILADEPTGNLDRKNRISIMKLFTSLMNEGITLVLVTHDDEIATYSKRRILMQDGIILEDSLV